MNKSKTINDVRGRQIGCPSFDPCPMCFGCRAYDAKYEECKTCKRVTEKNICPTHRHRADLIARMIRKEVIEVR